MKVITVRNVHEALPEAIYQLLQRGRNEETRTGKLLVYPSPVTTQYSHPRERVIFWPQRDANPFFHFYEALWMLGGRNDVASLTRFVKRMKDYSDDGKIFHGAYGYRWRALFDVDQLQVITKALNKDPSCRRQVLQMWDCDVDLGRQGRDVPCNLVVCFSINCGALDMTVYNRSNDIVWGCYGANAVHFSMLQEVMAAWVGVPVGMYWQVSNNWHAYQGSLDKVRMLSTQARQPLGSEPWNPYTETVTPFRMVNTDIDTWFADLRVFLDLGYKALGYRDVFFRKVAIPILKTHALFKGNKPDCYEAALAECNTIRATDWQRACNDWIQRRYNRWRNNASK